MTFPAINHRDTARLWVCGSFPHLSATLTPTVPDDTPDAILNSVITPVSTLVTTREHDKVTTPTVRLLLTPRAIAVAADQARDALRVLTDRGPACGIHPTLALPDTGHITVSGAELAALIRLLAALRTGADLPVADQPGHTPSSLYLTTMTDLFGADLNEGQAVLQVTGWLREILHAADGVWSEQALATADEMMAWAIDGILITHHDEAGRRFVGRMVEDITRRDTQHGWVTGTYDNDETATWRVTTTSPPVWTRVHSGDSEQPADGNDARLQSLHDELIARGHSHRDLVDFTDMITAEALLGMDSSAPWHDVRIHFAPDHILENHARGRDSDQALLNAHWNWPTASSIDYVGQSYALGDEIIDATDPWRVGGVITALEQGPDLTRFPQLHAQFEGEDQAVTVTRDQISHRPGAAQGVV